MDAGYTIILGDRKFLKANIKDFDEKIQKILSPILVRGLSSKLYKTKYT